MTLARDLDLAETIAREASEILMRYYRGDYRVEAKAGGEPVTEADRAANEHIVARLQEHFPNDGVLAEESADPAAIVGKRRVWMVDPMDGTKEFTRHLTEFAVMIGLVVEGTPVLGVVAQPAEETVYRGIVGEGAERVHPDGVDTMRVGTTSELAELTLICSRSHLPEIVERMKDELGISRMLQSGSVGLKIGKIGTGVCDLYLQPASGTKLWDACAPEAILHAAGGRLTDFDGRPIDYDPHDIVNRRGLLGSNGTRHDDLVQRLRGYF